MDEGTATEELAYATGKSGASLTIPVANRGLEGGSAQAHAAGTSIKGIFSALMWNDLIDSLKNILDQTTGAIKTALELEDPVLNGDLTGDAILDEDDMASDSATKVPTQQSVKAYVDTEVAGVTPAGLSSKVGSVTRDMSTATGTVAITGIGFQPTSLQIFAVLPSTSDSRGFVDSSCNAVGITRTSTSTYQALSAFGANTAVALEVSSGNYQYATISAYGADGFTFSWNKVGSPTGTATITYIAYK